MLPPFLTHKLRRSLRALYTFKSGRRVIDEQCLERLAEAMLHKSLFSNTSKEEAMVKMLDAGVFDNLLRRVVEREQPAPDVQLSEIKPFTFDELKLNRQMKAHR